MTETPALDPNPIQTWDQKWFLHVERFQDDEVYYLPTDEDLTPVPASPTTATPPTDDRPDDTEIEALLFEFQDGKRVLTSTAARVERLLRGNPQHQHLFGSVPFPEARHNSLTKLVGLLVKVVHGLPDGDTRLVYALARQATDLLEPDTEGPPWADRAWEMTNAFWSRQKSGPVLSRLGVPGMTPDPATDQPLTIPEDDDRSDQGEIELTEDGVPRSCPRNVRVGLRLLGARVEYDEFQDRNLVTIDTSTHLLDDRWMRKLWLDCREKLGVHVKKEDFWDVVLDLAAHRVRHPVREYLDSLTWDNQPRVDNWTETYLGVPPTPFSRAVGRLLLTAAVRRVRRPGAKFDELVLLEGPQGGFKSSALRALAVRDSWFSDSLPLSVGSKEVLEQTLGKWIIEAGDLQGMSRRTVDELKAFLSRGSDRARLAYERTPVERPRQFVIVGTTNSDAYLLDGTGNRRFWPLATGKVDLPALTRDRDQLWAEAAHIEATGETTRLDPSLYPDATQEQESRRAVDPHEETLQEILPARGRVRTTDLFEVLGLPVDRRTQADRLRLGGVMRRLGWDRRRERVGTELVWLFTRGDGPLLRVVRLGTHRAKLVPVS